MTRDALASASGLSYLAGLAWVVAGLRGDGLGAVNVALAVVFVALGAMMSGRAIAARHRR